jgi:hypothetical protein
MYKQTARKYFKTALARCLGFANERLKKYRSVISNVTAGRTTLCCCLRATSGGGAALLKCHL